MSSNPAKGPFIDAEPARRHVRNLMASGVSVVRIARHAGISFSTVSGLLYTRGPERQPAQQLRTENARRILAVRACDVATRYINATGTHRRIQALAANGWPQLRLGPHIGLHPSYVNAVLKQATVYGTTAMAVATGYDRLWNQDPRQHGITAGTWKKVRSLARANGWAPPGAWDDDTIDDPQAIPEWTGHCGSDRGWWLHTLNDIPICPACEHAHNKWKAARAHLDPKQRWADMGRARAAAASRGADLAADARELLAHKVPIDQAAHRLGVSLKYLQQALARYPEQTELAA